MDAPRCPAPAEELQLGVAVGRHREVKTRPAVHRVRCGLIDARELVRQLPAIARPDFRFASFLACLFEQLRRRTGVCAGEDGASIKTETMSGRC
jgi:hypothetical protein